MRNEKAIDSVGVRQHALKAATRTGTADWMQEIEQSADAAVEHEVIGLGEILRGDLALTLKTRNGSDVQLSARIISVLGILLLACASCAFYLIYTTATVATAQRYESEIRARDNAEVKAMLRENQAQVVSAFATTNAYIAAHSNKVQFMTGLLTKEQQERVYKYDQANPMPPRPEPFKFREQQNED